MDKPTAALSVMVSAMALDLIGRIQDWGMPVALTSYDTPHVFETADSFMSTASESGLRSSAPRSPP